MNTKQYEHLTERDIDEIVVAQANDDSAWEEPIMRFAGVWSEMPNDEFEEFMSEIMTRRHNAIGRRENEYV